MMSSFILGAGVFVFGYIFGYRAGYIARSEE